MRRETARDDEAVASNGPSAGGDPAADSADVPSPCVQVCKLDTATMTCIGCGRLMTEIRDWTRMDAAGKRAVWDRLRAAGKVPAGS
jgi:predicted Fe-S protein YdhL (DUF1289 family)